MLETLSSSLAGDATARRASLPQRPVLGLRAEWRNPEDLAPIVPAWCDLAERATELNVFFEPDVLLPALKHLADGRRVHVLLVWRGDRLLALLPLTLARLPFAPGEAKVWTHPLIPAGTPLVDREAAASVLEHVLATLASGASRLTGLALPRFAGDGALMAALRTVADRTGRPVTVREARGRTVLRAGEGIRPDLSPDLPGPAQGSAVTVERARTSAAVRDAVEAYLRLEASERKARRGAALLQDAGAANFVRTMTRQLARASRCRVDLLKVDGRAVAAAIVLKSRTQAWLWTVAADEGSASIRPAERIARAVTGTQAAQRALALTESCVGDDCPAIDRLWSERLPAVDVVIALEPRRARAAMPTTARETARHRVQTFASLAYRRLTAATR